MREKKMSQRELAKEIGLSNTTIAIWCTGKKNPSYTNLKTLASFFGVSTDYFLAKDDRSAGARNRAVADLVLAAIGDMTSASTRLSIAYGIGSDYESYIVGAVDQLGKLTQQLTIRIKDDIQEGLR